MKRIGITIGIILILILSVTLISCTTSAKKIQVVDLSQMVDSVGKNVTITMSGDVDLETLTEAFYIPEGSVEKFAGKYSLTRMNADNFIAIKAVSGNTKIVEDGLQQRIDEVKDSFANFKPEEYEKAANAKIITKGDYVFLVMTSDNKAVEKIIASYF
jgi:hypothetical protein